LEHRIPLNVTLGVATSHAIRWYFQQADARLPDLLPIFALKSARRTNSACQGVTDPNSENRESYEQNLIWANRLEERRLMRVGLCPYFQPILDFENRDVSTMFECVGQE